MVKAPMSHFSRVASRYQELRMTDVAPVRDIREGVKDLQTVVAADIGCGTGRYSLSVLENVPNISRLFCFDANKRMLAQLENKANCSAILALAEHLPLLNGALDCLFTFNAVHHFRLPLFVKEASRVIKGGGFFFIYTRLKQQNSSHIWGRFFPHFSEKETRLYDLNEIVTPIERVTALTLTKVITFVNKRVSSLARLRELAEARHYSTFDFYSNREFRCALAQFEQNLRERFEDMDNIRWIDENVLLVINKNEICT